MNSCVCEMPGMTHSLTKIKYSFPFLGASSLPLMSLSDFIFCCPSQLLLLFFPFGICPCFPASRPLLMLFILPCLPFLPLSFPPFQILLPSLFSSNVTSSRKPLLPGALCALDKNTDNRSTTRGRSLPTMASFTFCLGQTQTSKSIFLPHPAVHKSAH